MKVLNTKKTKYEQVADILEKDGYISDTQAFKIWRSEEGVYKVLEHKRIWQKLQADRNFFADKKIVEKLKGYRSHLVRVDGMGSYYRVGKEFFNEIKI